MSRNRKQKNREKKERKALDQQRARVSSDDIWSGIRYSPLSDRGYPSVQRLEADSEPAYRKVEGEDDASCTVVCKGWSSSKQAREDYYYMDT